MSIEKLRISRTDLVMKASILVYKEGYNINVLKNRWGQCGYEIKWPDGLPVRTIHRLQQKLLSDMLDDTKFINALDEKQVYFLCRIMQTRQYPSDPASTELLNTLKTSYLKDRGEEIIRQATKVY